MDFLWDKITEWLKEMLVSGIVSNLSGMFDATNQKVAEISGQVGLTPQAWNGSIFNMIQSLSETVIVPIAGAILAFVMTLELIQLITDKNNLHDVDTWMFFKWAFKSAAAILIVTNTWTIVMGIFDVAQSVVASASGLIIGDTSIDISGIMVGIEDRLMEMELGPLFGLWFQSLFVGITMWALTIAIFIVTFGRMIDGYVVKLDLPELRELVSLLRYSSNNLNQLAKRAHETGRIYEADMKDIQQNQERIWTAAEEIISMMATLK